MPDTQDALTITNIDSEGISFSNRTCLPWTSMDDAGLTAYTAAAIRRYDVRLYVHRDAAGAVDAAVMASASPRPGWQDAPRAEAVLGRTTSGVTWWKRQAAPQVRTVPTKQAGADDPAYLVAVDPAIEAVIRCMARDEAEKFFEDRIQPLLGMGAAVEH